MRLPDYLIKSSSSQLQVSIALGDPLDRDVPHPGMAIAIGGRWATEQMLNKGILTRRSCSPIVERRIESASNGQVRILFLVEDC
jgi:hypothetical protein